MLGTIICLSLFVAVVFRAYRWIKSRLNYFEKKNIFQIKPSWKPYALYRDLYESTRISYYADVYKSTEGHKCVGTYHRLFTPTLVLRDPDLIRVVLFTDFENFSSRSKSLNYSPNDLSAYFLTNLNGQRWHWTRTSLSSAFTPSRLKFLLTLLDKITAEFLAKLDDDMDEPVAMYLTSIRYQFQVMASWLLGIHIDAIRDEESLFYKTWSKMFLTGKSFILRGISSLLPPVLRSYLGRRVLNDEAENFIKHVVRDVIDHRRTSDVDTKQDFLQYFMKLMRHTDSETGQTAAWTFESTVAQSILFMVAGIYVPSALITLALYELAKAPMVQMRLYGEIKNSLEKSGGQITYDGLHEMVYLNNVASETLRKYPFASAIINRECVRTCRLSNTSVVVEKGTRIIIPAAGIHYDPKFYPEPEIFDPDRFNEQNKRSRHPFTFLPFSKGPRNCPGQKLSQMNFKYAVARIISEFEVRLPPPTDEFSRRPIKFEESVAGIDKIKITFVRRKC